MELRAPRQCPGREHGGTKETLGGIRDRCEEQPWSFRALQLPWVHPVPSPTQRTMIPTEMLSTRLGQSTFHTKRWQCVPCIAPGDGLHLQLTLQSSTGWCQGMPWSRTRLCWRRAGPWAVWMLYCLPSSPGCF